MLTCSANRFSILAGLNPSPETKWPFDFVPTARSGTRRRGKRGGRQQRLKHASKKKCEKTEANSIDELCDRFAALRLDDDAVSIRTDHATPSGVLSGVNAVRHHWAPQFHPKSLPTPNPTLTQPAEELVTSLSQNSTLDRGLSADVSPTSRKSSPKFPLSAFLKDLVSSNDCPGYRPPRNPTSDLALPPHTTQNSDQQPARLLLTSDYIAGGCSPNDQSSNIGYSQSNAIESQRTVPTTSSLSTNAVSIYKRFPVCEASPTLISGQNSRTAHCPKLTLLPPPPVISRSPYPTLSQAPTSAMLNTTVPDSQKSYRSWQESSEGTKVFSPSSTSLITAPVTSPYPFVYPPQPWTPSAMPSDLFKHTAVVPSRLKSRFAVTPDPSSRHVNQEEFLAMGHDPECWCDRYKKTRQARDFADQAGASGRSLTYGSQPPRPFGAGLTAEAFIASTKAFSDAFTRHRETSDARGIHAPVIAEPSLEASLASSFVMTPGSAHTPHTATELKDHAESESFDEDVVMITPTSEVTDFGSQTLLTPSSEVAHLDFEGLEVLEGIPINSENDWPDNDWTALSIRLYSQQSGSSLAARTVSDAPVQNPSASAIVSLPSVILPSPPRTPPARAQRANVSDIGSGSETD